MSVAEAATALIAVASCLNKYSLQVVVWVGARHPPRPRLRHTALNFGLLYRFVVGTFGAGLPQDPYSSRLPPDYILRPVLHPAAWF
jgi:hypothetical protein